MYKQITAILFITISLLLISCEEDNPVADDGEHFEAAGYVIIKDDSVLFRVFRGQIDTDISDKFYISLSEGEEDYHIEFLDEEGNNIGIPEHDDHDDNNDDHEGDDHGDDNHDETLEETSLSVELEATGLVDIKVEEWEIHIIPLQAGETNFRVQIMHFEHADFTTPFVPLEVR